MIRFFTCLGGGFAAGGLFGVIFGALASVFQNGPTLSVGVAESWFWFAVIGAAIAVGWGLSQEMDGRRSSAT